MNKNATLKDYQNRINEGIKNLLPSPNASPPLIHQAMHYSMLGNGKRLRPTLLLTAHELFPSNNDPIPAAVAIECIHTYSLIHDDLPCMDNSNLRRGQPTNHKQFDEATALLAGDALLTYAFFLISEHYKHIPETTCTLTHILSDAAGSTKLIGGQIEDLHASGNNPNPEKLHFIHQNKTAALITASFTMGLHLANAHEGKITLAKELGHHLGMAFQIIDDILDVTSNTEALGKTSGLDTQNETLTYPAIFGLDTSSEKAREHTEKAIQTCQKIGGNNDFLIELITSLEHRLA